MNPADHPLIVEYLEAFDHTAGALGPSRRPMLREDIAQHLREAIRPDASNADVAAILSEFGSPAEIIAHELADSGPRANAPRTPGRDGGVVVAAALAVVLVVLALVLPTPARSIVNATPNGPERISTGQAYEEYRAAIEAMVHPLPPGAEYPRGIPAGLDAGPTKDRQGVRESGAGEVVANFTWLCAWETEYLAAFEEQDDRRLVLAERALLNWTEGDFYQTMDAGKGWKSSVVDPMRFGDRSGVQLDQPEVCAQAFIFSESF